MDEREMEVACSAHDPDISVCIKRHFAGTEVTAGQETRIDERGTGRVEFGKPSAAGELRQGSDARVRGYWVVRIWAEACEDRLTGAVHGDGYALEPGTDKRGVNQAGAVWRYLADEWGGIRKLSCDGGLKGARSDRPESTGVAVDVSVASG